MPIAGDDIRVLLVEDDAMSRELWTLLLAGEGYEVQTAESGELALARIGAGWMPDVVLMDMQMPGIAGALLATAMREACGRSTQRAAQTIVLAMSGSEPRGAGALEGFDGFLLKPFTMEALAAQIVAALAAVAGRVDSARIALCGGRAPGCGPFADEVLNRAIYARLAASMPATRLGELYALCLQDARLRIERMGEAALAGDDAAYRREAHAIKGSSGMVGATELARLAAAMEEDGVGVGTPEGTGRLQQIALACDRLEGMLRA